MIWDIVEMNTRRTARKARMTLMPFVKSILALGLSTSIVISCWCWLCNSILEIWKNIIDMWKHRHRHVDTVSDEAMLMDK